MHTIPDCRATLVSADLDPACTGSSRPIVVGVISPGPVETESEYEGRTSACRTGGSAASLGQSAPGVAAQHSIQLQPESRCWCVNGGEKKGQLSGRSSQTIEREVA